MSKTPITDGEWASEAQELGGDVLKLCRKFEKDREELLEIVSEFLALGPCVDNGDPIVPALDAVCRSARRAMARIDGEGE